MQKHDTSAGLIWRNEWERYDWESDDPSSGTPFAGEQATMCARWDVRTFWKELARRHGLSENASMVAVELWWEAVYGGGLWTNYSRSDEHYEKHPKSVLYTKWRICGGVDELDEAGLVWSWRQAKYAFGWQSAVKAKPELIAMVQAVVDAGHRPYPARPKSVILLRDADGNAMPFRETAETRALTRDLLAYNDLYRTHEVSGGHGAQVRRVFNDGTFDHGGRHYCIGLAFQRLPAVERAKLTICGVGVGEYDYGSIHPCMLYRMAGLPIPDDAYDLEWWSRDLQKVAFLVLINAGDRDEALHAIAGKDEMAVVAAPGSDEAMRVAAALYAELEDRHRRSPSSSRPVSARCCSGGTRT